MLETDAGRAAFRAWAATVARRVDGVYVAFDADCLDASGRWAVAMPEPAGLEPETAVDAIRTLATAMPLLGFGPTGISLENGDAGRTADAVVELAGIAFA